MQHKHNIAAWGHGFKYDTVLLTEIGRGCEFFRVVGRQECAVEREALWRITKLRVDGGHVINVSEVLAAGVAVGMGLECFLCLTSYFLVCSIMLYCIAQYLKCYKYIWQAQIKVYLEGHVHCYKTKNQLCTVRGQCKTLIKSLSPGCTLT
jgi:hypothetical protein